MKRKFKLLLLTAIITGAGVLTYSLNANNSCCATCSSTGTCKACKNCKYCKHCSKDGGTCSVCKKK